VTYLTTSLFLFGYVFGPLFWGPGSELFGRKPIFIFAMVSYTLFILGQALAPNIETLLVTRFLSGFFAVAPLTNCGGELWKSFDGRRALLTLLVHLTGIIADIWDPVGRGPAISLFAASVFLGPVLGPIVSA
jgi:DHA1 family multidrug resistance protein-like MFS transporter